VTGAAQLRAVQRQHGAKRGAYVIFLLAELDPSKDPSSVPTGRLEVCYTIRIPSLLERRDTSSLRFHCDLDHKALCSDVELILSKHSRQMLMRGSKPCPALPYKRATICQ